MSKNLPYIMRSPQFEIEEGFANYHTTQEFYQEVHTRSEFDNYCQWYEITAEQHRQDLEKMRGELNIFQWFRRS
ncbi:hypothetical protein [Nodularia sphaerocarpa]|uniref:hypothetical protein n=1 Tax=Nodularia sphaerocarpa TaxID=137816 RepID=UPI001EFA62FC|nr:hypothetical protein [Nodularia sphaerocarpa]MDB9373773.1 hypothetical protein [Nodularia sphaerocarpa CS-585]MDB9377559.1 hypothetical protein [Nodularia sphaerocarpa CS-585A2]ULP72919.1 hypothetical protein BDGGKGIB_02571 [Nodularia sphaerocarpa UHCC 0038]